MYHPPHTATKKQLRDYINLLEHSYKRAEILMALEYKQAIKTIPNREAFASLASNIMLELCDENSSDGQNAERIAFGLCAASLELAALSERVRNPA